MSPFVIVKARVRTNYKPLGAGWEYVLYKGPKEEQATEISPQEAKDLIREHKMIRREITADDGDHGFLWELPGEPFLKKFNGWFAAEKRKFLAEQEAKRAAELADDRVKPGDKFGKLTAVRESSRVDGGHLMWITMCDCGRIYEVRKSHLLNGYKTSCGCDKPKKEKKPKK